MYKRRWGQRASVGQGSVLALNQEFSQREWLWVWGSLCALHGRRFSAGLLAQDFPPPCTHASLIAAGRRLGFRIEPVALFAQGTATSTKEAKGNDLSRLVREIRSLPLPLLVQLAQPAGLRTVAGGVDASPQLGLITQWSEDPKEVGEVRVQLFEALSDQAQNLDLAELIQRLGGTVWVTGPQNPLPHGEEDTFGVPPPQTATQGSRFGFKWFVPALLKHRTVWRDVLMASLVLQMITLATPLFTQAIIDKVVVHRTQSTLIAIGVAMLILTVFSSVLTWVRQYLVLHTGNRVDAVLGAEVWNHLLGLPLRYFQHRPTGVVAARLHGVETIREFVSGAAVSLVLDLPFLLICVALMLSYSVALSAIVLTMLLMVAIASAVVAPIFQTRLGQQFQMGASNQAFITEHIAGLETVKCLQMEPQLRQRYADQLAAYLQSGFLTKQIGNTYNVVANSAEQIMTLAVLMLGAWTVMNDSSFTIGMLVAFQMFSSKLSQPVMRLVGMWSQFQQARLSVARLGDLMNVPTEPTNITPQRNTTRLEGSIEIKELSFRYSPELPLLYSDFNLTLQPGECVAIMGPSGSGKSTLAKLLMGFYAPTTGSIKLDGVDIRHLGANELRSTFGVVPQDTTLFSGTIFDNLRAGNPAASMEQVIRAAQLAGIHTTLERLPKGYDTEIGERGAGLSGGQKQRLAIARALLKGPRILIFDEATSALDAQTAAEFATTINQFRGKVGMILITHGLPKGLLVDRIIHLPGPK